MKAITKIQEMAIVPKTGYTVLAFKVTESDLSDFYKAMDKSIVDATLTLSTKSQKSLNANNYCWRVIGDIARWLEMPKDDVYRMFIREIGEFVDQEIDNENVKAMRDAWSSQGIGWQTEVVWEDNGITTVRFYKGSSTFDANAMRIFTDHVVESAKECNQDGAHIETLTPIEIQRMMERWK